MEIKLGNFGISNIEEITHKTKELNMEYIITFIMGIGKPNHTYRIYLTDKGIISSYTEKSNLCDNNM